VADLTSDFQFLVASARRFVGLLAKEFAFEPGERSDREERERGAALVRHISHTTQGLEAQVELVEREFAAASNDVDREEAIKKIRLWVAYAHFMRRALPWLQDAQNPPLDLGAIYFIDEMARALIRGKVDVIPTRSGEYSTERRPFESLFKKLQLSPEQGPTPIVLNFPALEASSFPLLPLFGHELAHTAVHESKLVLHTLNAAYADPDFASAVRQSSDLMASRMANNKTRARIVVNERLENWTVELLCDQLALQYLGPTFLLALAAYLVPLSWNAPGPRHPPTTMRIAHLLAWLMDTPWKALLAARIPVSLAWLERVSVTPPPVGIEPPLLELLRATDLLREHVSNAVSAYLGASVYNANEYLARSPHLDELLRHEVLPVQHPTTGAAFEGRAIAMAGWLSLYEGLRDDCGEETPVALCRALAEADSHAFFVKALEMSSVLRIWSELE
jgi:hypothetical protein